MTSSVAAGHLSPSSRSGAGGVTYTPDADYRSVKSFTYAASDGEGLTADDPVGLRAIPEDLIAATARAPPGQGASLHEAVPAGCDGPIRAAGSG